MEHGLVSVELAQRLKILRRRIRDHDIPSSALDESLNIAIWNVRDFGKKIRPDAAIHMIAEILNEFDLVAFVELGDNLNELRRVMDILGPYWKVVFNDSTPGYAGNNERIGFLYDKRMVAFTGFAAEIDPRLERPEGRNAEGNRYDYQPEFALWRSPYMAGFRAGTFDFVMVATHIRFDSDHEERRIAELDYLARWLEKRRKAKNVVDRDMIVVGDFNTPTRQPDDAFFAALTGHGLRLPEALREAGTTNIKGDKAYDHILHYPYWTKAFSNRGGVLRFSSPTDYAELWPEAEDREAFTYFLSDHFPVWIQLRTDIGDERLDQIINPGDGSDD